MENLISHIQDVIQTSIQVKQQIAADEAMTKRILDVALQMAAVLQADGKILFCGNGGSAADAQHLAAEFSGRFYYDREPLFAEALHVNTSYLTAVANDYSYEEVYSRLVRAKGRKGDMLVGLSTSGNSANIVLALQEARKRGMTTVGLTGSGGGKMKEHCDYLFDVPSKDTPRIQEAHILIGHLLCEIAESRIFPK